MFELTLFIAVAAISQALSFLPVCPSRLRAIVIGVIDATLLVAMISILAR